MKKRHSLLIFIIAIAITLAGCVMLVANRQNAVTQAKQIIAADQAGTNVETDLVALKSFAASHMKVNVEFVLTGSYDRAVAAIKQQSNSSSAMYAAAQAACDKRGVDSIRQSTCVANYIATHGGSTANVKLPDIADYTYRYVGPAWSFDIAGILLVLGAITGIAALVSVVHRTVTK